MFPIFVKKIPFYSNINKKNQVSNYEYQLSFYVNKNSNEILKKIKKKMNNKREEGINYLQFQLFKTISILILLNLKSNINDNIDEEEFKENNLIRKIGKYFKRFYDYDMVTLKNFIRDNLMLLPSLNIIKKKIILLLRVENINDFVIDNFREDKVIENCNLNENKSDTSITKSINYLDFFKNVIHSNEMKSISDINTISNNSSNKNDDDVHFFKQNNQSQSNILKNENNILNNNKNTSSLNENKNEVDNKNDLNDNSNLFFQDEKLNYSSNLFFGNENLKYNSNLVFQNDNLKNNTNVIDQKDNDINIFNNILNNKSSILIHQNENLNNNINIINPKVDNDNNNLSSQTNYFIFNEKLNNLNYINQKENLNDELKKKNNNKNSKKEKANNVLNNINVDNVIENNSFITPIKTKIKVHVYSPNKSEKNNNINIESNNNSLSDLYKPDYNINNYTESQNNPNINISKINDIPNSNYYLGKKTNLIKQNIQPEKKESLYNIINDTNAQLMLDNNNSFIKNNYFQNNVKKEINNSILDFIILENDKILKEKNIINDEKDHLIFEISSFDNINNINPINNDQKIVPIIKPQYRRSHFYIPNINNEIYKKPSIEKGYFKKQNLKKPKKNGDYEKDKNKIMEIINNKEVLNNNDENQNKKLNISVITEDDTSENN